MESRATIGSLVPDGHRSAERRSLAMHELVAQRLDERSLEKARERVRGWIDAGGPVDPRWARRWQTLLAAPLDEVREAIVRDDEPTRELRQTTPFAGALSNTERWHVLRTVS